MIALFQTLGWLACIVYATIPSYWLLIHPHAGYWRSRPRSPYRVLVPLWVLMWLALGALSRPWRHFVLYSTRLGWIPAMALLAIGIYLYTRAGRHFTGAQLGGRPELERERHPQPLVTCGIHGRVRHPVYLAHLCEMLAWSLGTGLAVLYAMTAFAVVTGAVMLHTEERELEQRFGAEYREYRARVPALFPRFLP